MSRVVSTKIEFEFDEALANEGRDTPMTDEEMTDYAISCFIEVSTAVALFSSTYFISVASSTI